MHRLVSFGDKPDAMKMSLARFEHKLLAELKMTVLPMCRKEPGYKQQQIHREVKKKHYQDLCRLMKESMGKVAHECFESKSVNEMDVWWKTHIEPSFTNVSCDARNRYLGKKKVKQWNKPV